MKNNPFKLLPLLLLFILINNLAFAEDKKNLSPKEYFNTQFFLTLAKETDSLPKKLSFLRQAMVLSPTDNEIRKTINEIKQQIEPNEAPLNLLQKESIIDFISTKTFLPFYLEDFFMIALGSILILINFTNVINLKKYSFFIFILFSFFLSNKLFVTYSRDGSLRFIKSFQDLSKTESIALDKINGFVSKDLKSDISFIVKEGSELDVFSTSPLNGDWIKIGFENGRTAWTKYDPSKMYLIVR
jgi:hypothetical protein